MARYCVPVSEENVEIVRQLNAAFAGSEPHPPSELLAPDAVWDMTTFEGWPDRGEYQGPDEFAASSVPGHRR